MANPRIDPFTIPIQEHLYALVFFKSLSTGTGVSVSIYIHGTEFLKYDCQGIERGHYHIYDRGRDTKLFFMVGTDRTEQIDISINDISTNITRYIRSCHDENIRSFQIHPTRLEEALVIIKTKMVEYQQRFLNI